MGKRKDLGLLEKGKEFCKKLVLPAILVGTALLCGCGRGEQSDEEYGYIIEKTQDYWFDDAPNTGFLARDGYLYYMDGAFCRISLEELNFYDREELYPMDSLLAVSPDERIIGYALDKDMNLYYATAFYNEPGIVVYKCSAEGEQIYQVAMEDEEGGYGFSTSCPQLALDDEGNVYVVSVKSILKVDNQGNPAGRIDIADMLTNQFVRAYLMNASGGSIFFFVDDPTNLMRAVYAIEGKNSVGLQSVEGFAPDYGAELYKGLKGLLIDDRDDILYRYDEQSGSMERVLRWEDCDLYADEVDEVIEIAEDRFLVFCNYNRGKEDAQKCQILTKVPLDEMPRKERIVLASLYASQGVKKAVVAFNQQSSQYHVSIESYGVKSILEYNEGAEVRLDSALASKDGPDLLDLSHRDIWKYANVGALDDLYAYMGEGGIKKEDYLSNMLEAFTVDGKLVTIPKLFTISYVMAQEETVSGLKDWSMESVMALSEIYPDRSLLPEIWATADYLMGNFCADYYLEKYIDWESGACSFDSEGFSRLLNWAKEQLLQKGEGSLLTPEFVYDYKSYLSSLAVSGGRPVLRGVPSVDGKGRFSVRVQDALSILANSRHKEGAWEFLRFYLEQAEEDGFPTRIEYLNAKEEEAMTERIFYDENGKAIIGPWFVSYIDGVSTSVYAMTQEDAEVIRNFIETMDFTPRSSIRQSAVDIVTEESKNFFSGTKSAEEVTKIIQNRVSVLILENL